jgi:hypothetical protein
MISINNYDRLLGKREKYSGLLIRRSIISDSVNEDLFDKQEIGLGIG